MARNKDEQPVLISLRRIINYKDSFSKISNHFNLFAEKSFVNHCQVPLHNSKKYNLERPKESINSV